jgi:hypothetical protein
MGRGRPSKKIASPTLFVENGIEKGRLVGAKSKDEIRALYNR